MQINIYKKHRKTNCFAVLLILEKLVLKRALDRVPKILCLCYSLILVFIGWLIFASDGVTLTAEQGLSILSRLFFIGLPTFAYRYELVVLLGAIPFIFILIIGSTPLPRRIYLYITKRAAAVSVILPFAVLLICVAYIVSSGYNLFLYFRF